MAFRPIGSTTESVGTVKTFRVTWLESRQFKCSVDVEAETEDEAYDKSAMEDQVDREEETNKSPDFEKYVSCVEKPTSK